MSVMTGNDGLLPAVEAGGEPAGPPRVSGRQLRELLADDLWLDELIDRAGEGGVRLTGEGGFLPELVKAVLERGLQAELTGHLGMSLVIRPVGGRGTRGMVARRRRCRRRSARSGSTPRGIGLGRSSRGWCRRGSAAWAAWTRSSSRCMRVG